MYISFGYTLPNLNLELHVMSIGAVQEDVLHAIVNALEGSFSNISVNNSQLSFPVPLSAYNRKRGQYRSSLVLNEVKKRQVNSFKVLGVTEFDLFAPGRDFVFGEAEVSGKAGIMSLYRLRHAKHGIPADDRTFLTRCKTEAIHEVGHMFGFIHCRDPNCVMFSSKKVKDTDRKGTAFCIDCLSKLETNIDTVIS
jgi:archaemetzincin